MVKEAVTVETPAPKRRKSTTTTTERKPPQAAAMARFRQKFEKDHSKGRMATGEDIRLAPPMISTGSMLLDYRLGTGGLPMKRSSELWGNPGSCKTTTLLQTIAAAQRQFPDRYAAFVDVEGSFDRKWAQLHGVDMDQLQLFEDYVHAEEWADVIFDITGSDLFSICGVDSIGALIPAEEFRKKADEPTVGTKAKLITRMVHQVSPRIRQTNMALVYVNQIRAIVSGMGGSTTGGGFALKHVSSVQAKHTEGAPKQVRVDGELVTVGKEVAIKAEKNKLAPPKQVARPVFYQKASKLGPVGIDQAAEAFQLGKLLSVFERSGNTYILPSGEKLVGEEKVTEYLRHEPEELATMRQLVMDTVERPVDDLSELEDTETNLDLDEVASESLEVAS